MTTPLWCETTDMEKFGARGRSMVRDLLDAWNAHGLPDGFHRSGVVPMFNTHSGYVFLVNDDYQMAICLNGRLEMWHVLPYGGEGTLGELLADAWGLIAEEYAYTDPDDLEYLARCCYDSGICPACAEPVDYCQGHGQIGDPVGFARLRLFGWV